MSELIETRNDIRLLSRALREEWPVSQQVRQTAVDELVVMLKAKDPALRIAAIDLLRKIDAHNLAAAKAALPNLHLHQHQHGTQSSEMSFEERRAANARRIETLQRLRRD